MNRKNKTKALTAATLLSFLGLAWLLTVLLPLQGGPRRILPAVVAFLGLAAAFTIYRYLSKSAPKEEAGSDALKEIDRVFSEVEAKLKAAGVEGGRIGQRPVVILLGKTGSTKTTVVEKSGTDAELLAGDVYRGSAVVPTEGVNVWFGEGTLFVEAGGRLLEEPARWSRLMRHLRPRRLAAVLGRGKQAPRLALVCFPCDELQKPGRSDSVETAAREIRDRLLDLSKRLGIRLPVYVLFTKADRIPDFEEYMGGFTTAELWEVLGATLPIEPLDRGSAYADRQATRLTARFDELVHSLALRRLDLLRREGSDEGKAGVYEFPRELGKIRESAIDFMVQLCRPSQLAVSPFLRGFFFTGVRPIVVEDAGSSIPDEIDPSQERPPVDASRVFQAGAPAARPAHVARAGKSRRVPEWVFLRKLFNAILLKDEAAMRVTGGGTHVNLFRRGLAIGGIALGLIIALGVTTSFFLNRALRGEVATAIEGVGRLGTDGSVAATLGDLRTLDSLLAPVERLTRWEEGRAPWRYRWGLNSSESLLGAARPVYFSRFDPLLGRPAERELRRQLEALRSGSGGATDRQTTYDALKALLTMTGRCPRDPEHLSTVLPRHWYGRYSLPMEGDDRLDLLQRQFRFAGVTGHTYEPAADGEMIARAQDFLQSFTEVGQYYSFLVSRVSSEQDSVRIQDVEGSRGVLSNRHAVPGAFTAEGWESVHRRLASVDGLAGESCVTGGHVPSAADLAMLADSLRIRYRAGYVEQWQRFLEGASISNPGSAGTVSRLAEAQSPLFRMLYLVSNNTSVDPEIARVFQSVHTVMPPDTTGEGRLMVDENAGYVGALRDLRDALDEAERASGADHTLARENAAGVARRVAAAVEDLEGRFPQDRVALSVGRSLVSLLEQPALRAQRIAEGAAREELAGEAATFCSRFSQLASRYPFNPAATEDASIGDVDAVLKPGDGSLWQFYESSLRDHITRLGEPNPGADPDLRPSTEFRRFFRRAVDLSDALYGAGPGPEIRFLLILDAPAAIPRVTVRVDGQRRVFTRDERRAGEFVWNGALAEEAAILDDRGETVVAARGGTWALFRMLGQADWRAIGGGRHRLTWRGLSAADSLTGEIQLTTRQAILEPGAFAGLRCPPIF